MDGAQRILLVRSLARGDGARITSSDTYLTKEEERRTLQCSIHSVPHPQCIALALLRAANGSVSGILGVWQGWASRPEAGTSGYRLTGAVSSFPWLL
jgi:hypothetical protein